MKPTRTSLLVLIAVAVMLVSVPFIASAQSDRPNRFSGNAFIDGQKAPAGTLVEALSGETVVGTTRVQARSASINYVLDVTRPQGSLALTFKVGGYLAGETSTWQDGSITFPFNLNASGGGATPNVPPHAFSGLATVDGKTAKGGINITALIEGEQITATFTSNDGKYKLLVQQGTQSFIGKRVTFTIDQATASQSAFWRQGGVDLLDLSAWSGPRPVAIAFSTLISDGSLVSVWRFHNETKSWSLFDPRPEAALLSDLTEVNSGDVLWVEVSEQSSFQGRTLYKGWNLVALR